VAIQTIAPTVIPALLNHMSKTYVAALVSFLVALAAVFNIQLPETPENIEKAILVIVALGAFIKTLTERYKKGGVSYAGFKI
jgi:hypothetical protein